MLLAQFKRLLVNQHDLVLAGMDFLAAYVVWVDVWVAIDKLLAVCHLVDQAIVFSQANGISCLGQQYWDVLVFATALALIFCFQVCAMGCARPTALTIQLWRDMDA